MKLKQRETGKTGVMRACLDLLEAERIRHWRMNAGDRFGSYKGKTWRIRGHAKGTPDILAAFPLPCFAISVDRLNKQRLPAYEFDCARFVWIEVKAPGNHPTAEQLQFADDARNNGEYWLLVDDPKQLQEWLKENRAR